MDTFKRETLMRARTLILQGEGIGICEGIVRALRETGLNHFVAWDLLEENFPEFTQTFPTAASEIVEEVEEGGLSAYWWPLEERSPRISCLDSILCNAQVFQYDNLGNFPRSFEND